MSTRDSTMTLGDAGAEEVTVQDVGSTPGADVSQRSMRRPATTGSGRVIGRYVILERIGAGGMGVVYSAYDPRLERRVAIKLVRAREATHDDERAGARLFREAQLLAKLSHPNVVAIHDVGQVDGRVWLAMEYVEGRTLRDWAHERRSWTTKLKVMVDAGRGLAAAHAAGLLHRDFKPDNVMISSDARDQPARVRVMDFGLARGHRSEAAPERGGVSLDGAELSLSSAEDRNLTDDGMVLGTPAYLAPEQWSGVDPTPLSDQFSFCVALWEVLYGARPFVGATVAELAVAVLEAPVQAPSHTHVPQWLRRVCERGLARDPTQRFASMDALVDALSRGQARARRTRWALAGVGVAALIGAGLTTRGVARARVRTACNREAAELSAVWNDERAAKIRTAILATELDFAEHTANAVERRLDALAEGWRESARDACLAYRLDETWDRTTYDKAAWCLAESRLEIDALTDDLGRGEPLAVTLAAEVAADLSSPATCRERQALQRRLAVPREHWSDLLAIEELLVRTRLTRQPDGEEALELLAAAADRAAGLGFVPLYSAVLAELAAVRVSVGQPEGAAEAAEEAYYSAARSDVWDVAFAAARQLARIELDQYNRPDAALVWAKQAALAARIADEPGSLALARALSTEASVLLTMGRAEAAVELHEQAQALASEVAGEPYPRSELALRLALALSAAGRHEEAIEQLRSALALREQALGPDHPKLVNVLHSLGSSYGRARRPGDAAEVLRRAAAILERTGEEGRSIGVISDLGAALLGAGEPKEARETIELALRRYRDTLPPNHPNIAMALSNLADADRALGDFDAARKHASEAIAMFEADGGPDDFRLPLVLGNLGVMAEDRHSYAKALEYHARAMAIREARDPIQPGPLSISVLNCAGALRSLGRFAEAEAKARRSLALRESIAGSDDYESGRSYYVLAASELGLGREDSAREHLARAKAIADAYRGSERPGVQRLEAQTRGSLDEVVIRAYLELAEPAFERGDVGAGRVIFGRARELALALPEDRQDSAELRASLSGPVDELVAWAVYELAYTHAKLDLPGSARELFATAERLATALPGGDAKKQLRQLLSVGADRFIADAQRDDTGGP